MTVYPFKIVLPPNPGPLVAHIPHAASVITAGARPQFLLPDDELRCEIIRLTDWHADHLFSWVTRYGGTMFVGTVPRLIFDPERFADDAEEPMAEKGQGVLYTRSTQGELLREIDDATRADLIENLYEPYHEGLTALVQRRLDQSGQCLILDCHSFATVPLPSELSQTVPRPDICIGTDSFHTPAEMAEALESAFTAEGLGVSRDTPFSGTLVPLEYYHRDARVKSVMIEVRRGLYCDEETGERNGEFERVRTMVERAVSWAPGEWLGPLRWD